MDKLTRLGLKKLVGKDSLFCVRLRYSVDSTNSVLKRNAKRCKHGDVLIVRKQTKGRGRFDRKFHSPADCGVYMSMFLQPDESVAKYLTIIACVAVARAVEMVSDKTAQIKWVNDVYVDGGKVAGILTEASTVGNELKWAIVGIGINTNLPKGGFAKDISGIATCLNIESKGDKNRLAAAILHCFEQMYTHFDKDVVVGEYAKRSMLIGKMVQVSDAQGSYIAQVEKIDQEGRLCCVTADGQQHTLCAGEARILCKH